MIAFCAGYLSMFGGAVGIGFILKALWQHLNKDEVKLKR